MYNGEMYRRCRSNWLYGMYNNGEMYRRCRSNDINSTCAFAGEYHGGCVYSIHSTFLYVFNSVLGHGKS